MIRSIQICLSPVNQDSGGSPATPDSRRSSSAGKPVLGGKGPQGESLENPSDLNDIIFSDEISTTSGLNASEEDVGQEAQDRAPVETASVFGRGDGETREQVDASIRRDQAGGVNPDRKYNEASIKPELRDAYFNNPSSEDFDDELNEKFNHAEKGHSTGAFTDIGEGRSSVTRRR